MIFKLSLIIPEIFEAKKGQKRYHVCSVYWKIGYQLYIQFGDLTLRKQLLWFLVNAFFVTDIVELSTEKRHMEMGGYNRVVNGPHFEAWTWPESTNLAWSRQLYL